jgi:hypothetical protein
VASGFAQQVGQPARGEIVAGGGAGLQMPDRLGELSVLDHQVYEVLGRELVPIGFEFPQLVDVAAFRRERGEPLVRRPLTGGRTVPQEIDLVACNKKIDQGARNHKATTCSQWPLAFCNLSRAHVLEVLHYQRGHQRLLKLRGTEQSSAASVMFTCGSSATLALAVLPAAFDIGHLPRNRGRHALALRTAAQAESTVTSAQRHVRTFTDSAWLTTAATFADPSISAVAVARSSGFTRARLSRMAAAPRCGNHP